MNDDNKWEKLDEIVHSKLPKSGSLSDRVEVLQTTIYEEGSKLFGLKAPYNPKARVTQRREAKIGQLISHKLSILEQISLACTTFEESALRNILKKLKQQLKIARRAENSRKRRWKRKKARQSFFKNPFEAAKNVLSPKVEGQLRVEKIILDDFLTSVLSDQDQQTPLGMLDGLRELPLPGVALKASRLKETDFEDIVSKRRNASAPGPNKVPYKVYKKCNHIRKYLFLLISSCFDHGKIPIQWRIASLIFIPKVSNPSETNILDFRQIALMNVEAKLFWALIARRLYNFFVKDNAIVNTAVQKGSIEGMPGCWEHMSMVWQTLKDARLNKGTLSSIWLDIANAYGSVPHKLVFFSLNRYGIPEKWINLIKNYYKGLWSCSFSANSPSSWHQHQKGIFAGCTISVILFLVAINTIIEYATMNNPKTYTLSEGVSMSPMRAFMDDLSILSPSVTSAQTILDRTKTALDWARMQLNTKKSRSIVIKAGRTMNTNPFQVSDDIIPSIHDNPVKFLGRVIDGSLTDRKSITELTEKLQDGLALIDKSDHTGVNKVWIMQNLLMARLRWTLMIYEIPMSSVESLQTLISISLRKWLGLNKNITSVALYSKSSPCPLPIKSLSSIFKCAKAGASLQLKHSKDPLVRSVTVNLDCGRKWRVQKSIDDAEQRIAMNNILGHTQTGRAGFGSIPYVKTPLQSTTEYRKLVSGLIMKEEDECFFAKSVQLSIQGQWTKWQNYVNKDLSWKAIWALPPNLLSFCIGATYDTLSSPNNLFRWGLSSNKMCPLCSSVNCTVAHVLSGCKKSLQQGRYTYRHNSVLKEIACHLGSFLSSKKDVKPSSNKIRFVKQGHEPGRQPKKIHTGILHLASDWKMIVDLNDSLRFPGHIVVTTLRPDIVLFSNATKRVILLELTCPCEENIPHQHDFKINKYCDLVNSCQESGWKCDLLAVEVGARGYSSTSMLSALCKLGFDRKSAKSVIKEIELVSLRCSFWIWCAREKLVWEATPVTPPVNGEYLTANTVRESGIKGNVTSQSHKSHSSKTTKSRVAKEKKSLPVLSIKTTKPCVTKEKKVLPISTKFVCKPQGLINLGNTCYLNATIQCLFHIPSFTNLLLSNVDNSVLRSLHTVRKQMQISTNSPISPNQFKVTIGRLSPRFANFEAQDAQDFLNVLLEEICSHNIHMKNLFQSSYLSCVSCDNCFIDSEKMEFFNILQVPISAVSNCTLEECIEEIIKPEHLTGENRWNCYVCDKRCDATKTLCYSELSNVLIVQLLRFSQTDIGFEKDNTFVQFPTHSFNMSMTQGGKSSNINYSLKAVTNHSGTLLNGHYTAYVRKNDHWFFCNDSVTTLMSTKEVVTSEAYLLFYEKI